jgi:hypothetical protein
MPLSTHLLEKHDRGQERQRLSSRCHRKHATHAELLRERIPRSALCLRGAVRPRAPGLQESGDHRPSSGPGQAKRPDSGSRDRAPAGYSRRGARTTRTVPPEPAAGGRRPPR